MHRTTLDRFAETHNIPVNKLDHVLVSKMIGATKDPVAVYKALKRDQLIRNAAKAAGITLADVLSLIDSQKQP